MSRANKLKPVVEITRRATEQELNKLGESNALLTREQAQLDDLIQYRAEYLARFRSEDPTIMSAKKALELRGFLVQLDQAISAQQQQVKHNQQLVKQQQQLWLEARNKEQAVEKLVSRYQAEETQKQLKQEQKEADEHTTSIWFRSRH